MGDDAKDPFNHSYIDHVLAIRGDAKGILVIFSNSDHTWTTILLFLTPCEALDFSQPALPPSASRLKVGYLQLAFQHVS